ncbi:hypothetical protein BCR42DRAFT_407230 [Absidia repens]|uniref:Uncharacterized protein n=1 Tax=Absidia repens TaxID=90262 RepID=A0A1X2IRW3_9FUNG|nr:hypothetical protein BCR42DRAFT_407230 [Absidia repens]
MDGSDNYNEQADPAEDKNAIEILESEDDMQTLDNNNTNDTDGSIQRRNLGNDNQDTITGATTKPLDEIRDDENINSDYTDDDDHIEDCNGDVTLLSPPHSDQKQTLSDGSMDDDVGADEDDGDDDDDDDDQDEEIDELNDDEDDAPSKRRRTEF